MKNLVVGLSCFLILNFSVVVADLIPDGVSREERSKMSEERHNDKMRRAMKCRLTLGWPKITPGSGPVFCKRTISIPVYLLILFVVGLFYRRFYKRKSG